MVAEQFYRCFNKHERLVSDCCHSLIFLVGAREHFQRSQNPEVNLKVDGHTRLWRVQTRSMGRELLLSTGWKDFVKDNAIKNGDMMFFKCENGEATVTVFVGNTITRRESSSPLVMPTGTHGQQVYKEVIVVSESTTTDTTDCCGTHCDDSAPHSLPTPACTITMSAFYIENDFLNIPVLFARDVFFSEHVGDRFKVLLRMGNRIWTVYVKQYCPNRSLQAKVCDGWTEFVRDNNIQEGDVIGLKLLKLEPRPYELLVTIERNCPHSEE